MLYSNFCDYEYLDSYVYASWNTTDPDLSQCFQMTVFPSVLVTYTIVFCLPYLISLQWKRSYQRRRHYMFVLKITLTIFLLLTNVGELAAILFGERHRDMHVPASHYFVPSMHIFLMVFYIFLQHYEFIKCAKNSGFYFCFWLIFSVTSIARFRSCILAFINDKPVNYFIFIPIAMHLPVVLTQLILSCITTPGDFVKTVEKNPCPLNYSSFLSRLTFWWYTRLVILGYRKTLDSSDVWPLNASDRSKTLVTHFQGILDQCLLIGREKKEAVRADKDDKIELQNIYSFGESVAQESTDRIPSETSEEDEFMETVKDASGFNGETSSTRHCVLKTIIKAYWRSLFIGFVSRLISDTLSFFNPQLLKLLLKFIADESQSGWNGYFISIAMFCCAVAQSIITQQHYDLMSRIGMRIRSSLNGAIYRKSMKLSNTARRATTVGKVVNLMAVDCQKFQDVTYILNSIWASPYVIAASIYFLYQELGPSVFAGVAVMILIIPLNAVFTVIQKRLQAKTMKIKDGRIRLINEMLNGIKALKLYSWEKVFGKKVHDIRENEVRIIRNTAYVGAFTTFSWYLSPFLVSFITFTAFELGSPNNILTVEKTFSSLALFNLMRMPMVLLPLVISLMANGAVALKRVTQFLLSDEIDPDAVIASESLEVAAEIKNGYFSWHRDACDIVLKDISIKFPEKKLTAIVGPVGCGKSSIISALLGEMVKLQGSVHMSGSVAYVSQVAWIRNATVRENILFGKQFDADLYERVISACALKDDFDILSDGDRTEIGEKGINLSGGQKQRISLARACYAEADVYLLDDPLSAVDAHVSSHIASEVLGPEGILRKRTRILVTHSVSVFPQCHMIISLGEDGRVQEQGKYMDLVKHNGAFSDFINTHLNPLEKEHLSKQQPVRSISSTSEKPYDNALKRSRNSVTSRSMVESVENIDKDKMDLGKDDNVEEVEKLIKEETSAEGRVKFGVFSLYIKAVGILLSISIILCYTMYNACQLGSVFWLSKWSEDSSRPNITINNVTHVYADYYRFTRIGIYGVFGLGQLFTQLVLSILWALALIRTARGLHADMLDTVLSSPMVFFETTPMGRILNRFSKDIDIIDTVLTQLSSIFLMSAFSVLTTIVAVIFPSKWIIIPLLPIIALYIFMQRLYITSARQLKRMESISKSPVYSHFSETLQGVSTIRAFNCGDKFIEMSNELVDENINMFFLVQTSNRWLTVRLEQIGNIIVLLASIFAVVSRNSGSVVPGLTGLAVTYALQITFSLSYMIRMASELEANIVSVERIKEYTELETEAAWIVESSRPPADWPKGSVRFEDYSCRYREGLDLVLNDVSFEINPGEKIGVVGRTGAGKSSLVTALFRIIESAAGRIVVDDIDVSKIGLYDLRSRLTTIPQDPVLFSGSIRLNIDPEGTASDQDIWNALEDANLSSFIRESEVGLDREITEGGENFSVGQRQLVCLARALLRRTKILVLDEATSAVDLDTDLLIQKTIRQKFSDATIFTIAHRLHTIMDYDKILVMNKGEIEELDTPDRLLKNPESLFYSMAKDAKIVK